MEKASDIKAKANLQLSYYVGEINFRCPKDHCPSVKEDKEDIYWEPHNEASKDKDKTKSQTSSSANQPQTQAPKKGKRDCRRAIQLPKSMLPR